MRRMLDSVSLGSGCVIDTTKVGKLYKSSGSQSVAIATKKFPVERPEMDESHDAGRLEVF